LGHIFSDIKFYEFIRFYVTENMVKQMKILLMGPPNAGKTALLHRLTLDDFVPEYYPTTASDFSMQEFILDDDQKTTISTQIWDIGGNTAIGKAFTKGLSGVVLVVDVNSISNKDMSVLDAAYEKMMTLPTEILYDNLIPSPALFPFLIVLNKVDTTPDQENYDLSNVVTWLLSKGPANPENINIMGCSAKTGYNVMALFETIIKSVLAYSSSKSPSGSVISETKPTSRRASLKSRASITAAMLENTENAAIPQSVSAPTMNIQAKIVVVGSAGCG
jgi:small GTP-binding protein